MNTDNRRPRGSTVAGYPAEQQPVPLLRTEGISKRFDNRPILRSIDLQVGCGECVVLFGPNGAGKTTLLRVLATLSRPTTGTLSIDGLPVDRHGQRTRARVGFVAHQTYLYDDLTAAENLHFYARMYDVADIPRRISEALELVGLISRRNDRVRTFSRGMQQRLAIARAILHQPPLLLLDEPDTGLDREGIAVLERILADLTADGGSVVMTTHDLGFGFAVADRVLYLDAGRLLVDAPAGQVNVAEIDQRLATRR